MKNRKNGIRTTGRIKTERCREAVWFFARLFSACFLILLSFFPRPAEAAAQTVPVRIPPVGIVYENGSCDTIFCVQLTGIDTHEQVSIRGHAGDTVRFTVRDCMQPGIFRYRIRISAEADESCLCDSSIYLVKVYACREEGGLAAVCTAEKEGGSGGKEKRIIFRSRSVPKRTSAESSSAGPKETVLHQRAVKAVHVPVATGDFGQPFIYMGMMAFSAAGTAALYTAKRKRGIKHAGHDETGRAERKDP